MFYKPRYESKKLKGYRVLNKRMTLALKEESYYQNLEKGSIGEKIFDEIILNRSEKRIVLNDLSFEVNNTKFQIDSLMITQGCFCKLEIKNFEGDFYMEGEEMHTLAKKEVQNPLLQIKRSDQLFRRLLLELGINFEIESKVIFVNPEFYLYQASQNLPFIFPAQINRYLSQIGKKSSTLNHKHTHFAEKLMSRHVPDTYPLDFPSYNYEGLRKGITCLECSSFSVTHIGHTLHCTVCGCKEDVTSGILRSIEEFRLLFPDWELTTNIVFDWCSIIKSKKTIWRILVNNFQRVGASSTSRYVDVCE